MRDAEEICYFPIRQSAVALPEQNPGQVPLGMDSFSTD